MKRTPRITRVSAVAMGLVVCSGLAACSHHRSSMESLPRATISTSTIFPADLTLHRAEDGVALADGRLIVSDQVHGLRMVHPDGSSRPFGGMPSSGYLHDPPNRHAAANGVSLEPGGTHVLVADVLGGGIYRVAIADGATERVYQHAFGVNTACRDSTGVIWFTQSTDCTSDSGESRMFAAADVPVPDGSLWRLGWQEGRFVATATRMIDGLYFANGIAIDETRQSLYLAETCADRVLRFSFDVKHGRIGTPEVLAVLPTPDNLELDCRGRLWVASPINNEVGVLNLQTGELRSVFRQQSQAQAASAAEFTRRGKDRQPRIALFLPESWQPLPGPVTGVILGPDEDDRYVSGLGNALIRLPQ